MTATNVRNEPYLSGVHAPVSHEVEAANLPVEGELPAGLRGMFVRNGPNPMFDLDLPAPVMMHDFVITDRHAVFLDAPAVFDFAAYAAEGRCFRGSRSPARVSVCSTATATVAAGSVPI
jgi:carotenoid cleavage dioxygenase-like enzyme